MDYQISEEVAQKQFDDFCEWYGLDFASLIKTAEGTDYAAAIPMGRDRVLREIRAGHIEIREDSTSDGGSSLVVVQHLARPKAGQKPEIVYKELTGAMRAGVKTSKDSNRTEDMYRLLARISGCDTQVFHGLRGRDIGIADAIGFLFLQV